MTIFKKYFVPLLILLIALIGWVLLRTFSLTSSQLDVTPHFRDEIDVAVVDHLQEAIRIPTITYDDYASFDSAAFYSFASFLKETYPLCDSLLKPEMVNEFGFIYKWKGKEANQAPVVLMGHYDVVPIEPGTESAWEMPPFSGAIKDGYIWGRGSIDNKSTVITLLESAEKLLHSGFQPDRPIYMIFGFDEEIGGRKGALAAAELLESQGESPYMVLDEGGVITDGIIPGIALPVALIGTAQKGYLSLELSVKMHGGHSSMPGKENALTVLNTAVQNIHNKPFPPQLCKPVQTFLSTLGPEMPFVNKMAFANLWLFEGMVISQYEKSEAGNATVKTTTAPTMIQSGVKQNVIPSMATATVNFRILPGLDREAVTAAIKEKVNDERVTITALPFSSDPMISSGPTSDGFKTIEKTIRENFPGTLVVPSLVIATTDSRHFTPYCSQVYNHQPIPLNSEDLTRFHGINERIAVEDLKNMVRFYTALLKNCSEL